jgi:conjugative relaxase-like TrwC/TraI family protein
MLRITQQRHASAAKAYYAAKNADYYLEDQELVGAWGGIGTRLLGLEGTVGKAEFDLLCENRDPRTGERLTPRRKSERTVGYDFTWSVPKSVSLLYALTEDKQLLDAFRQAVDETMRELEAEMKTRVRKGGRDVDRVTGNVVWATFFHFTSRPVEGVPDPQMHAHCFVFNATWDSAEERWKAGQFRDLKRDAPYWQAAFRVRLANQLQEMGFAVERKRDDFEIAGIPAAVLKKFSRRTAVIEDVAAERGITDPDRKAELGALTREHKNNRLTWPQLREEWKRRLTDPEDAAVTAAYQDRPLKGALMGGEKEAVDHAILHSFERESVVPEKALLAEALRRGIGQVTVERVRKELSRRDLLAREVEGRRLVTSPDVLREEHGMIAFAREGRGTCKPLVGFDRPLARTWLNEQQQRAVRHLWQSPDRVLLLRGAAGTGKTTLLQEAIEGIEAAGHRVVALAPSAEASRGVLREAGFKDADTVARFLRDERLQREARGGVLLIDEASLLGSRTLARVFDLAGKLDSRVILVGDTKQHGAVERGAAFRLLQEQAAVPVVEVTDIRRQRGRYREAVRLLSEGKVGEGFEILDRLGWVEELPAAERERRLAADYLRAVSEPKRGGEVRTALIVAPTHAEGARVTAATRGALRAAGKLGEERTFAVWTPAGLTEAERADAANLAPGDMLQFHKNVPGHRNGSRLVVRVGEERFGTLRATRFIARPSCGWPSGTGCA